MEIDIDSVVNMYNIDGKDLTTIGQELGTSKSSVSRVLKQNGWVLDRAIKQYIHKDDITKNNKTINTGNNKTINNVPRETLNTVKCTFDLPSDIATALKVKSAVEGTKMVKIVEKLLRSSIENKYFDIK